MIAARTIDQIMKHSYRESQLISTGSTLDLLQQWLYKITTEYKQCAEILRRLVVIKQWQTD